MLQGQLSRIGFRALTAVARVQPDRVLRAVAWMLAPLHYFCFPHRRRAVAANLAVATGTTGARRAWLALSVCASYNAYFIEFLRLSHLTPHDVLHRTRVDGAEHLRTALESGRGIVAVTSHIGNWEWCAAWMAAFSERRVLTPAGVQLTPTLHPHVMALKRRHHVEVVQPHEGFRGLYRALVRREIVGLALDGDIFQAGRRVELFGQPTVLGSGAARLAHRTGAVILHLTCVRIGGARFALTCEPLIGGETPERSTVEELDRAMRVVQERQIRRHAAQWCMFRPLWGVSGETTAPAMAPAAARPATVWPEARRAS